MKMKGMFPKILVLVAAAMFLPSLAHAAACGSGNLGTSSYGASSFTCTIDGLTFGSFGYSGTASGTATAIPAASVLVTPCSSPTDSGCASFPSGEVGFIFNGGWSVTSGGGQDSLISYTVSGSGIVDALNLMLSDGCTGTGNVTVDESISQLPLDKINTSCNPNVPTSTVTFGSTSGPLSVTKDVDLSGGSSGTANVSFVANGWSTATPEPGSIALLGSGLMGIAGLLRKKRLI